MDVRQLLVRLAEFIPHCVYDDSPLPPWKQNLILEEALEKLKETLDIMDQLNPRTPGTKAPWRM